MLAGYRLVPEQPLTECYRASLRLLRERSGGAPIGDYLEFGVYHGASLACMYRASIEFGSDEMRFFGFDSFAGLPADAEREAGPWRAGQYRCSRRFARRYLARAGVDWRRVVLVKGWFTDTLRPELARRHKLSKAGVIMIDCDLYSSAVEALRFSEPLIRGSAVVVFDDWHSGGDLAAVRQGEKRAFDELLARKPELKATPLPSYCSNAEVFLVTRC